MSGFDAESFRAAARDQWARSAPGWRERRAHLQAAALPVSRWMVDALALQPGHRVLELAAGAGDTGLLAAELIEPGGTLICSDASEEMLGVARERAAALGAANVEFRVLEAEWIDLVAASVDAVLCRWGYMLLADPAAALRETRRVLRPAGRVALAAWDAAERNPWSAIATDAARGALGAPPPDAEAPGMFSFRDPERIRGLLLDAGFGDVAVEPLELELAYGDVDEWWEDRVALSIPFADALGRLDPAARERLRADVNARLAGYADPEGRLSMPARAWVAAASA